MKNYLLHLLIILIIISCSSENQTKVESFNYDGTWALVGQREGIEEINTDNFEYIYDENEEIDIPFINIKDKKIFWGWIEGYDFYLSNLSMDVESDILGKFNTSKDTITLSMEGDTEYQLPNVISNDTLITKVLPQEGREDTNFYYMYIRVPKYSPESARDLLIQSKEDLDLQLISQKQYDSIKKSLSKYIRE